jgi:DNA excision repair protein ERCC-4
MAAPGVEFHRAIFADVLREDGLLVMSRGLCIRDLIAKLVKLMHVPSQLVFVLNSAAIATSVMEALRADGVADEQLPATMNNQTPAAQRQLLYKKGGCCFVTSRILVVDLLTKRVDPLLIAGFLVCDAHMLSETSTEAFILRIFRTATSSGFIKAFCDDPMALVSGFSKLENTLKALFVRKLYLWPHFQHDVKRALQSGSPEVRPGSRFRDSLPAFPCVCAEERAWWAPQAIELAQRMSPRMVAIQEALFTVMRRCLEELRR